MDEVNRIYRPSERPDLYCWEQHSIIYNVPVLKSGDHRKRDEQYLRPRILELIKRYYEGGEMPAETGNGYFWWVGAIEDPTVEAKESGATARTVLSPIAVLSNNRDNAIAAASKEIEGTWEPTRTRFIVRAFQDDNGKY